MKPPKRKPRRYWTAAEVALLAARYADEPTAAIAADLGWDRDRVYRKASVLGLKKSAAYLARVYAEAAARAVEAGKMYRFTQGLTPWNKGTHFVAGGRSEETRFKKGQMPQTWRPIGSERVSKEGYLQRKMTDTGVTRRDYVSVHRLVWLAAGRDIPPGHALLFRDGDKRNFALDNLELVSRQELMSRNTVHNRGPEVAQLIQLRGAITRQINRREGKPHE